MMILLKSHVKAHTRKDGTYVREYTTKVQKKAVIVKPASPNAYHRFLQSFYDKDAVMPKAYHPRKDENGDPMPIYSPLEASAESTWADGAAHAVFVPDGKTPDSLGGVALAPWRDHPVTEAGWDYVDGQMDDLDEPGMKLPAGKSPAAGVVIEEADGRVWVVHPTNGFAGYKATFPKGHSERGLSLQATAIKECFEESGLKVKITGFIGDVERGQTVTRYYRAERVGGTPAAMGWETQAVSLLPAGEVSALVNRDYDKTVAKMAGMGKPKHVESIKGWKQTGKQAGSNPGGVYQDHEGARWYCKFPETADIARNEVLAGKLYEALGVAVPALKLVQQDGHTGVASRMIPGVKRDAALVTSGKLPGVYSGFVADAWLANWDVAGTGHDNLLVKDGHAVRIDTGGSLLYRAQGAPKGEAFGDVVNETDTFLDVKNVWSHSIFKGIGKKDIAAGVQRLAALPDAQIRALVEAHGPGDAQGRDALAERLVRRKNFLIAKYG